MTKRIVKHYTSNGKLRVVLETLKEDTINQIASRYEMAPTNIADWKKKFLENAVKEYKERIKDKEIVIPAKAGIEEFYKEGGKLTAKLVKKSSERRGFDLEIKGFI